MTDHIKLLTAIEYFRDGRPWRANQTVNPDWSAIESAVRQMENFSFPIVQLHCTPFDDDEDMLNIIGGDGRYAMFHMAGEWQYFDPEGGTEPAHLWESDQGYDCLEQNITSDVGKVLRIAKHFYETGSCAGLDLVA